MTDSTTEPAILAPTTPATTTSSRHREDERIGKYTLRRELGRGGMGEVWEAVAADGSLVAIKLMHSEHASSENLRGRFMREARLLANVQHKNVVGIRDVFATQDGGLALAMERLHGESLRERLERAPQGLSLAETTAIMEQLLQALSAIHAKGVVHRDLKPDNLFLVGGSGGELRVLDFGIASAERIAGRTLTDLTQSGAIVGTPAYMAPEQLFGEAADNRSDLWSVGVVAYTCLTGTCPTDDDALGGIIRRVTKDPIVPIRSLVPDITPALANVIDAVLHKERDQRPSSAEACLAILHSGSASAAQHTLVLSPASRQPSARPRSRLVPLVVVVLALGGVGAVAMGMRARAKTVDPAVPVVADPAATAAVKQTPAETTTASAASVSAPAVAPPVVPSTTTTTTTTTPPARTRNVRPAAKPKGPTPASSSSTAPAVEDIVLGK